jgi:hypothetical protein
MAWSFNVFTGNLDQTGSSGAVVFEGEEETFDDLPVGIGNPPVGASYLVRTSTGVWLVNRRQAGIWIRRNNTGVRATDWEYGGDYPVNSVNGQTGNVSLTASSVGAAAATHAASHAAGAKASFNGQVSGMSAFVFIRAVNEGTAGNSITLTFNGSQSVSNRLSAWNSANPSNQATLISGDGAQVPDNLEEITLSGGITQGSDPITDPVFDSVGVGHPPNGSARKFHQHGGKFTVESDSGSYGQFQVINPNAEEVSFVFAASATAQPDGTVTSTDNDTFWAFGAGTFGNTPDTFTVGNQGAGGSIFHIKAPTGYVGIGANNSDPAEALDVDGNIAMRDLDNDVAATFDAQGNLTANRTYDLPDASGTLALTTTAPASHSHGNLTNAGAIGSTAGLPVVTTTSGAVTTLALGSANQVLKVNSGGTAVEFGAAGGVTSGSVDNAVLRADGVSGSQSQSSDLIVDDPVVAFACTGDAGTDIITAVGHNFTENQRIRFQSLTGGSGLFSGGPASSTTYFVRNISGNTFQVSTTSGGAAVNFTTNITAGAVLAVQRNLTLRTRKQSFAMTANASNDTITATGHTFVDGDAVSFYNLVGGAGLDEVTRWFVRDAATDTFKVSTSATGAARDITTSYTGGTVELEVPVVLGVPRFGGLILGDKPDGTIVGGNIRGYGAVDLQTNRNGQNAIASGTFSFIGNGQNNTASGTRAIVLGGTGNTANNTDAVVCGGEANGASGVRSIVCGGSSNNATAQWACIGGGTENSNGGLAAFVSGASNTATGAQSGVLCGRNGRADRDNMFAHATGLFAVGGDAQTVRVSLRNRASTATAVELFMGYNADTRFTIPSGKTMSALINIIAATSGGEFANRYIRAVTIANRGGTTALRGAVKDIDTDEQIGGADVTISANDTNDAIRIEFSGVAPVTGCTTSGSGTAAVINKVAHGYSNNDDIVFTSLTGGAGLTVNTVTYWVINATADTFQVSATRGGTSANISTNYTDMTAARLFRVVAGIDAVEVGHGT